MPRFKSLEAAPEVLWPAQQLLPLLLVAIASIRTTQASNHTTGASGELNLTGNTSWLQLRGPAGPAARPATAAWAALARAGGHSGYAIEVSPPPASMLFQYQPAPQQRSQGNRSARASATNEDPAPRLATSAGAQQEGVAANRDPLLVSSACERDSMLVRVRTGRPFYGVIHTLGQRRKLICTAEGDGSLDYQLAISLSLRPTDPAHCGAFKVGGADPGLLGAPGAGLVSVVLAVRWHRNIELSEDKFFALNCTNRCRRPDCSSGPEAGDGGVGVGSGRLLVAAGDELLLAPERPASPAEPGACAAWWWGRPGWWPVALLVCLATVMLLGLIVSSCLVCSSLRRAADGRAAGSSQARSEEGSRNLAALVGPHHKPRQARSRTINYDNSEQHHDRPNPWDAAQQRPSPTHDQEQQLERSQRSRPPAPNQGTSSRRHR